MDVPGIQESQSRRSKCCGCCGWRGFCSLPHGKTTILALIFAFATYTFVGLGVGGCNMFRVDEGFVHDFYRGRHHGYLKVPHDYGIGPYMRQNIAVMNYTTSIDDTAHISHIGPRCVAWRPRDRAMFYDEAMRSSMAFALLTTLALTLGGYLILAMTCCEHPLGLYCWNIQYTKGFITFMYMCAVCFQILAFSAFGSELVLAYNGKFAAGSYFTLAGIVSAALTAIFARPDTPKKQVKDLRGANVDPQDIRNAAYDDGDIQVESIPELGYDDDDNNGHQFT